MRGDRLCSAACVLEEEGASETGALELGPPAHLPWLRTRAASLSLSSSLSAWQRAGRL